MLTVPFVLVMVALVLLFRRSEFFSTHRSQQMWYVAGFVAVGIFGTFLIQSLSVGVSPVRAIISAVLLTIVGTGLVVGIVKLRGKVPQ